MGMEREKGKEENMGPINGGGGRPGGRKGEEIGETAFWRKNMNENSLETWTFAENIFLGQKNYFDPCQVSKIVFYKFPN